MNYRDFAVAQVDELQDGEMKSITIDEEKILISKIQGRYYALSAVCAHYGAPLQLGVLNGERLVCPWHHACYNTKTGNLQEPPALNGLSYFKVRTEGKEIIVSIPEKVKKSKIPDMVTKNINADKRSFCIVGAGAAGNSAAQALRENGFKGRIVMITREEHYPYDRPNLSKDYLQGAADYEWMPLRSEDFYDQFGIEILLNREMKSIDFPSKKILLDQDSHLPYDTLLLATGGIPRKLGVEGEGLQNVFSLRSFQDADNIIAATKNASMVTIIGSSFIGMETAFSMSKRGLKVTVVSLDSVPFEATLGKEIGEMFQQAHEKKGTKFILGVKVARFEGRDKVERVVLENGETIATDMVIVGIGIKPATDNLKNLGLHSDGSINVDEYFRAADGVYAVGDIACFPYWQTGESVRIEHWRTAEQQGRIVAQNMLGKQIPYRSVPFFWTTQVGLSLRYVGYVNTWDDFIVHGNIAERNFIAFFCKHDKITAAAGIRHDKEMAAIEELFRMDQMPLPTDLKAGKFKFNDVEI